MNAAATLTPRAVAGLSRTNKTMLGLLGVISLALLACLVYPIASPLLFAAVLAGALYPWQARLATGLGNRRWLAAAILTLGVTALIAVPAGLLGFGLTRQVGSGLAHVQDTLKTAGIPGLVAELPDGMRAPAHRMVGRFPGGEERLQELAEGQAGRALATITGAIVAASGTLLQAALMLVALYFMLSDGAQLVRWIAVVAPLPQAQILEILSDFRNVSVAVLLSSLGTAGAQTATALVGIWPLAFLTPCCSAP